jgi:hypothetical protein
MVNNDRRRDPYKNFNFRVALGAALAGLAAFVIAKKVSKLTSGRGPTRRNAYWRMFGIDLGRR